MSDEASRVLEAALELTADERAVLAAILRDSVGDGSSRDEIEASWIEEAKRRLAEYKRGESTPVEFEDAMQMLESKQRRTRSARASVG